MKEIRLKIKDVMKVLKWLLTAEWEVKSDLTAKTIASFISLLDQVKKDLIKRLEPYVDKVGAVYTDSGMVAEKRTYQNYQITNPYQFVRAIQKLDVKLSEIVKHASFNKTNLEKLARDLGFESIDELFKATNLINDDGVVDFLKISETTRFGVFKS